MTKLGKFTLYAIEAGRFKLDGGAMFGVVPKMLWSKQIEPDDMNRIPMALRCLLITSEETGRVYLVDNGIGDKFDEKFQKIYGVDLQTCNMESSLQAHGFSTDDITDVIFSHLHFDHCGGTTTFDDQERPVHVFANARYWVTQQQWETANQPNKREEASFLKENIAPMREDGRLQLISEGHRFEQGLSHIVVNGHTLGQQLPLVEAEGQRILYAADLLPTFAHIPTPWIMGFDMYPVDTLREKEELLPRFTGEQDYLFMEHDAFNELITLREGKKYPEHESSLTLADLG